jgi:proline dehydrogenase
MGLMRALLLAGSESAWLRTRATRSAFVRRSVARFMPGESAEEALGACASLQADGTGTILTHLGENLATAAEADQVREHYLDLLARIAARGVDTQISVKPTQLGLDLDEAFCLENLIALADRAEATGNFVWIDMESSSYVDRTIALYRGARQRSARVGLCLQAYLYRTTADLEALIQTGPAIRLVKGAYREPARVAYPRKRDTDEQYFRLARRLLTADAIAAGARLGIGTHDGRLIDRVLGVVQAEGVPRSSFEVEMLYGIQTGLQRRLAGQGWPLRVLISYGASWFAWYMRRLAERPANVVFVLRSLLARQASL